MAKKIRISGEIGYEVTPAAILQQLTAAGGEDLELEVASVGGDVFAGIEIFNAILDYKRKYPNAAIMITAKGVAASMASYLMMVSAFTSGISAAEENAVFMIHNAWNIAIGDYREMQKNADFLKGLSDLSVNAYVKQTKKSAKEIRALLDDETWLFGQQIKDAGFVDEIIPAAEPAQQSDAAAAISAAKLKFRQMQAHAKAPEPEKVAAMLKQFVAPAASTQEPKDNFNTPAVGGGKKTESAPASGKEGDGVENLKELQTKHPEIYAEAVAAGVKAEQERVASLAAMKKDKRYEKYPSVIAVLDECIGTPGKTTTDANALIVAVLSSPSAHAAAESPGDLHAQGGAGADGPTGEERKGAGEQQPVREV